MKLKPLFDRVIVEEEKEDSTSLGIFIGQNTDGVRFGKVIYVGDGIEKNGKTEKMYVKEGQRILFSKFTATEATIDRKKLMILRQTDILAIIE